MKKLGQILVLVWMVTAMAACTCNKGGADAASTDEQAVIDAQDADQMAETEINENAILNEVGGYGAVITADGAEEVDVLLAEMGDAPSIDGKIKATVSACCQSKGCWMDLEYGEGESMRVSFRDYDFFVPYDLPGREVIVQGTAQLDTLSVDYLKHLAEDAGQSAEKIETITEPSVEVVFVADGVLVI